MKKVKILEGEKEVLKKCYDKDLYNSNDLVDISKDTDKEIEVNDFIKEEILEKEYAYFN